MQPHASVSVLHRPVPLRARTIEPSVIARPPIGTGFYRHLVKPVAPGDVIELLRGLGDGRTAAADGGLI